MIKIHDLKRVNMLRDLPDHLLELLASEAQLSIFGTHTRLFTKGEPVEYFYMINMGQVALKMSLNPDVDVILDFFQAGRSFGSCTFLSDSRASYSAECEEPCEIITLKGTRLRELFKTNHELAFHLKAGVARQYRKTLDNRAKMIMKTLALHPEWKDGIKDIQTLTLAY